MDDKDIFIALAAVLDIFPIGNVDCFLCELFNNGKDETIDEVEQDDKLDEVNADNAAVIIVVVGVVVNDDVDKVNDDVEYVDKGQFFPTVLILFVVLIDLDFSPNCFKLVFWAFSL